MPPLVRACIRSIVENHPGWEHCIWDEDKLRSISIDAHGAMGALGSWAAVANHIRLLLLARFGGIFLDADVECLQPLDRLTVYEAFAAFQDETRICNACLGARPGHPWIAWQLKHWDEFDQKDPASGVYLATAAPRDGLTIIPQRWCYPFSYDAEPEQRVPLPDSLMIHHWLKSWGPK